MFFAGWQPHVSLLRLCRVHGRTFGPASLFDWRALRNSKLLSMGALGSWENIWTGPTCSIGGHSENQSSCPWARRIRAVTSTRQGLIGHDAPIMPRVRHGHSGYGGRYGVFEGHRKEMSPVRSRILPSPILLKEVTATKSPCSLDNFLVVEMLIKRRITAHTSWSGGIKMLPYILTSRNTIILKKR